MAHTVGEMKSEKFGVKKIQTLIDHVLTRYQTIPDTLTCVELQAPLKTEGGSVADVEAYIDINTH